MRYAYFSVIALMLVSGCANKTQTASQDFTKDYSYLAVVNTASTSQCQSMMTIGGGLKVKCSQQ